MSVYYRMIIDVDPSRHRDALPLKGGRLFFHRAERIQRDAMSEVVPISEIPMAVLEKVIAPCSEIAGLSLIDPALMGVLNVTPDSFSDGGQFNSVETAVAQAKDMVAQGAALLDIGGESTRPGATPVSADEEIARTKPVIVALRAAGLEVPISIDTRKACVGRAALEAGAGLLNDVSAMSFDPDYSALASELDVPICLMHAQGDPKTMQKEPRYDDVLLDVYDYLSERAEAALKAGISRERIILDPGIGFGKTQSDNLTLLRRMSLFHSLGCPILLGVSRKRFIGTIGNQPEAAKRGPGSAAIGWQALSQGIQILRVHDMDAHRQMMSLWKEVVGCT